MARNVIKFLVFAVLTLMLLLAVDSTAKANDDFSLRLIINGNDSSELETIVIDPEQEMKIDLQISDVPRDITLQRVSVGVTFAGQFILTKSESLGNFHIAAGEDYRQEIAIAAREVLKLGNLPLVTGIYRSQINLEYAVGGQEKVWSQWKNIKILGNTLSTPLGAAGIAVSAATVAAILIWVRALAIPSLPAGATLPVNAPVRVLPRLHDLALERLEPMTRGRVVGNMVKAAKRRIIKDRCPICETRLKHGYCYVCKKSAKEVRNEFTDRLRALALQSGQLLANDQVTTLEDLCSRLDINTKLGTDVIATLKHAKLVKVRGVTRKITSKAVMAGISSGLSTVLWGTVGGFVVLSASMLAVILVISIVIPVTVTKSLQIKARRAIKRDAK